MLQRERKEEKNSKFGNVIFSFGFEVLTALTVTISLFSIVTPCISDRDRIFGITYRPRLHGRRISFARNQQK
jgi:hypothetical protein